MEFAEPLVINPIAPTAEPIPTPISSSAVYRNPSCTEIISNADIERARQAIEPLLWENEWENQRENTAAKTGFEHILSLGSGQFVLMITPLYDENSITGYWSSLTSNPLDSEEQRLLRQLDAFINTENDPLVCLQFAEPLPRMVDGDTLAAAYLEARIARISQPAAVFVGNEKPGLIGSRLRDLQNSQIEALLNQSFPTATRGAPVDLAATAELLVNLPEPFDGMFRLKPTFVPSPDGFSEVWLRVTDVAEEELQARRQRRLNQTRELALRAASLYQFEIDFSSAQIAADETGLAALGMENIPKSLQEWVDLLEDQQSREIDVPFNDAFLENPDPINFVFRVRNASNEDCFIEVWAMAPQISGEAKARRCFGLYRDVTRTRRLQSRLRDKKTLESLGVLAGGIAHDFNNMLMSILGYAELLEVDLRGTALPSSSQTQHGSLHNIEEIKQAANRASELCTSLLAYAGQHPVEKRKINLAQLVRATTELMEVTTGKRVHIKLQTTAEPMISADAGQLTQVIMNLVGNAADAMHGYSGGIELVVGQRTLSPQEASLESETVAGPSGEVAFIDVTDSGCGMSPQVLERMYEPFFTTKAEGRGLGMAAVHGIVANHNGSIQVTSAPQQGTQFHLRFPLLRAQEVREAPVKPLARERTSTAPRVLIVDDEENVREIVCEMLAHLHCETAQAADAATALALTNTTQFDYALVDITMPGMSGDELAHALLARHPDLKVVLSSGYTKHELPNGLLELCPFIHKPYTLSEIAAVLNLPYPNTSATNTLTNEKATAQAAD